VLSNPAHQEFHLVRAIIRGRAGMAKDLAGTPYFDWSAFLRYVDAQTLGSCIFHTAQSHSLMSMLPREVVESLRRSFLTQVRWNSLLLARVAELDAAFRRSGREVIFLKGLCLAQEYFGQIAARQVGDIDLLIKDHRDISEIEAILGSLGYRRRSRILGSRTLMSRYTHHMEFDGPLAPLDLHWVLRQHPSFRLDYSEIWQRKRQMQVRNVHLLALSVEHELVLQFLSIHNDLQLGVIRLKSFVDLYAILRQVAETMAWEEFFARRAGEGLLRMSVNVLDLTLDIIDCRSEFEALVDAIGEHRSVVVLRDVHAKLELFPGTSGALRRRTWALRLYETSPLHALWWWGVSLPFRLAEHR